MVTSNRDWPVNEPGQPAPCGATRELVYKGLTVEIYRCDRPAGHDDKHAQGIARWEDGNPVWNMGSKTDR